MAENFRDPICGMDVTPETAAGKSEYKGVTYFFCSAGCKRTFDKEPEKHIGAKSPELGGLHPHMH